MYYGKTRLYWSSQNSKCQDLPKFQFSGGGVLFWSSQNSKCQDLAKFPFRAGGGGGIFLGNQIVNWYSGQNEQKFCLATIWELLHRRLHRIASHISMLHWMVCNTLSLLFVAGVSGLDLCLPNCTWAGDMTIDLLPWDAGTDDGVTYMVSKCELTDGIS